MNAELRDFEVIIPTVDGKSVADRVTVSVPMIWDEELQTYLLTPQAHEIIDDTKARHMGLLLPSQLRQLRERLNLTQKEIGELLQVGEKSWSRWESGKHRPSRSVNLLMRALYDGELSVEYLERATSSRPSWDLIAYYSFTDDGNRMPLLMDVAMMALDKGPEFDFALPPGEEFADLAA
jgi:transcriptional regulator with XRE-family HTH domain